MRSTNKRNLDTPAKLHKYLSYLVYGLLLFGVMIIYSSTYVTSTTLFNDPLRFTLKHIVWVSIGLLSFFFFYNIKFEYLRKISFVLNIFVLICLGILAIAGIMPCNSSISIYDYEEPKWYLA